ncbi:flagellar cap protein FliD N-terminal domain-containing protein, partial [Bradyrhizobium guangdongense]|uniref:flagellar cap protein FliD N-terminal domain-containing protein n=1 Tax=Bradyrhizobium guangdongense TaxID=1325090 RepID=UPI0024C0D048
MTSVSSTTSSASSGVTVTTSGTTNSSSIDWSALIQAAVDAKTAQADTISTTITNNEARISAYQTLQSDLKTLYSGLASLSTAVVNSLSTSAFATRAASIGS